MWSSSIIICLLTSVCCANEIVPPKFVIFPPNQATNVSPDAQLKLRFSSPPKIGNSGLIRIIDASTKQIVDTIDLAIPVSPHPSGKAPGNTAPGPNIGDPTVYQKTIIGGYDFHFFPIIVRNETATMTLHNGVLRYGKTYIVRIDASILHADFSGITDSEWTFTTKAAPPPVNTSRVVVSADGTGDFNTVQGAIDWAPNNPAHRITISIQPGIYDEIVFATKKSNLIIRGVSRNTVVVGYPNNSAFNPPTSGPSRRPAFTIHEGTDIQLSTFTINNYFVGQAEALLLRGNRLVIDRMTLNGSGDALTTYGTIYFSHSKLTGHGDTILGYGAVFAVGSTLESNGPFTWTRTPAGQHGNVFVNSTFIGLDRSPFSSGQGAKAVFERLPQNGKGANVHNFPYAEMVLINTKTSNIADEGWGPIQNAPEFNSSLVRFMEYNTMDLDGKPVDLSKRHPIVKILKSDTDAKTISDYSRPEFVLGGWTPVIQP